MKTPLVKSSDNGSSSDNTDKKYNTLQPGENKIDKIKSKLDEVRITMRDNIDKVIERGENIDTTLEKAAALNEHSDSYLESTKQLKRHMYLQNVKRKALIFLFVLLILAGIICWIYFASK